MSPIKSIAKAEDARAIDVLTMGFSADPVVRWLYPEAKDYLCHFPALTKAMGGKAFEHESAYGLEDFAGVALWLPPNVHGDEDEMVALIQASMPVERLDEAFDLLGQLDSYHPKDEPCWYLPIIGVDPACRGAGHGSALMAHALAEVDKSGKKAYLESSNPRNMSLYERHGFEVIGKIETATSPPIHPMLRKAKS